MKVFNFKLESKLAFDVKFDSKCDGDCPEAEKPYLDPLNGPYIDPLSLKS